MDDDGWREKVELQMLEKSGKETYNKYIVIDENTTKNSGRICARKREKMYGRISEIISA